MNPQVERAVIVLDAKQHFEERCKLWRFEDSKGWRVVTEVEIEALGWSLQANELMGDEAADAAVTADKMVAARWANFLKENRRWEPSTENGGYRFDKLGYIWKDDEMCDIQIEDIDDRLVVAGQHGDWDLVELCARAIDGCAIAAANVIDLIEQELSDAADRDEDDRKAGVPNFEAQL